MAKGDDCSMIDCWLNLTDTLKDADKANYLHYWRYHNNEDRKKAAFVTHTRRKLHSSWLLYCYYRDSSRLTNHYRKPSDHNRLYEWPLLQQLSGVCHWSNLDSEYRSYSWEHICPPSDLRQLLGNDTNLVPGHSYHICSCCCSSLFVLERGLPHSGLCNCYIHQL